MLQSAQRLQREKGARCALEALDVNDPGAVKQVEEQVSALLGHEKWEARDGGLTLAKEYLNWTERHGRRFDEFPAWVDACAQLLGDQQIRVRTSVGETLALLCKVGGLKLYDEKVAGPLLASIEHGMTLERDGQALLDDDEATKALTEKLLAGEAARQLRDKSTRASRASSMQSTIFHDTAGWGPLESDVTCLQLIIEKCGADFAPRLDAEGDVMDLLCTCAVHMNRFVRGIAFAALEAAIRSLHQAGVATAEALLDAVAQASDLVARLGSGLCDEWANVRMAASRALRTFLVSLQSPQQQHRYFEVLLPCMCVNRYYVATGVANYSRETWRMILADKGRETIVKWLPSIVPFYIMQTRVANSEARDAAAKCIGELAARIDPPAVSPYATDLFCALIPRLGRADAWEVKEQACLAITEMAKAFPACCNLSGDFPDLLPSLSAVLADPVWSVRQSAAFALGELCKASDAEVVSVVLELCLDGLTAATRELDERRKYGGEDDLVKLKHERANDATLHSNQDTIDCCAVGDLDHEDSEQLQMGNKLALSAIYNYAQKHKVDLRRNSWERTDGCLYLVLELASHGQWRQGDKEQLRVASALEAMASVAKLRHFVKHTALLTTLWNVVPKIAKAVGAGQFGPQLLGFVEPLAYSLSCTDALAAEAAKRCTVELKDLLGRKALLASVQQSHPASLELFSDCLGQPAGPAHEA